MLNCANSVLINEPISLGSAMFTFFLMQREKLGGFILSQRERERGPQNIYASLIGDWTERERERGAISAVAAAAAVAVAVTVVVVVAAR